MCPLQTGYPETTNMTHNNKRSRHQQSGIGCKYLSGNNLLQVELIRGKLFPGRYLLLATFVNFHIYEIAKRVRFCLSYDPLKMEFYRLKNKYHLNKKTHWLPRSLSMTLHIRAKLLLHVLSYDSFERMLSTE